MNINCIGAFFTIIIFLTGCNHFGMEQANEITVPSYVSIEEYMMWAEQNNINLSFINQGGAEVNSSNYNSILYLQPRRYKMANP